MVFLTEYKEIDWRGNVITMAGEDIKAQSWNKAEAEASLRKPREIVIGVLIDRVSP
jgi:hypothetical protein